MQRDLDRALDYVKRVEEHQKDSAEVYMLMGKIYAGKKVMSQAMDYLRKATSLDPENMEFLLDHAIALFNLECYREAKQKFKRYLEYDPDNLYAKNYLSRIKDFEERKRREEEAEAVQRLRAMKKQAGDEQ